MGVVLCGLLALYFISCSGEDEPNEEPSPLTINLPPEVPYSSPELPIPINVPVSIRGDQTPDSVVVDFRKANEQHPYASTTHIPASGDEDFVVEQEFADTTQDVAVRATSYFREGPSPLDCTYVRARPFTVDITSTPDSGLVPLIVGHRIQFQPRPFFRTVHLYPEGLQGPVTTFEVPNSNQPYDSVVQRTYTRTGTFNPAVRVDFHTSNRPVQDSDTVRVYAFGHLLASMDPTNGPALLESILNLQTDGALANQARVRWGDGQDTLLNLLAGFHHQNIIHIYGLGDFLATVGFFLDGDSVRGAQIPVSTYNEPPMLLIPLPDMIGVEGDSTSFPLIPLMAYTADRYTQSNDSLLYTLQSQTGPAIARIDQDRVLRITDLVPQQNGAGSVVVRMADPQGLFTDVIVNTYTQNRPTMHVFLTDYNGNPINEGIALYNGTQTPFTGSAFISGVPGNTIISAWKAGPGSFQGTKRLVLGESDVDVTIPVIPYSALEGICTPEEFLDLMNESRNMPARGPPPEYELFSAISRMDLDSAYLGFQNGGVTIWIEKQPLPYGVPSDTLSDAEQDLLESYLVDRLYPYLPPNARPQIHKASWTDPTYEETFVGPTVDNIVTVFKQSNQNPGVITYDDNGDGIIDRGIVYINQNLGPRALLQEVLTAILAPGNVIDSMPYRTILQSVHTSPPYIQPVDSLWIDLALKIPLRGPGTQYAPRFEDWFTIP